MNGGEPMVKKLKGFYSRHKEIINYFVFGVITTVASLAAWYATIKVGVLFFADENGEPTVLLDAIGSTVQWVVGVIVAFVTNKKFVFVDAERGVWVTTTTTAVMSFAHTLSVTSKPNISNALYPKTWNTHIIPIFIKSSKK